MRFLLSLFAAGAIASSSSSSSDAPSCNVVKMSEQFLHAVQSGNAKDLHAMYARTALRYDNGQLSKFTGGRPWSVAQHKCVNERLTSSVEVTHFTRDSNRRSSSLAMKVTYGTEAPLDVLLNLEFNRHDCKIENEHYFYATEHPAYHSLVDATIEDCWGSEVNLNGPVDNILRVQECWSYLVDGTGLNSFLRCFNSQTVWTVNGAPAPAAYWDPAYWAAVFNVIDIDPDTFSTRFVQDAGLGLVSVIVHGYYSVKGSDRKFPFTAGQRFQYENGELQSIAEIEDERQFGPWMAAVTAAMASDTPVPAEDLLWINANAISNYNTAVMYYGAAKALWNVADGSGMAVFSGEVEFEGVPLLGCLHSLMVFDESILSNPALPNDEPRHFENIYAVLPIQLPEASRLDAQKVSRSVVYNAQAGTLEVRGGSFPSVVAQLYFAKEVGMGSMSVAEAQAAIGPYITGSVKLDSSGAISKFKGDFIRAAESVCA